MKGRSAIRDDSGVNYVLEYILTFMIASVIFSIMLMMSSDLFIHGPEQTVSKVRFTDVGNDLSAKIIDTYMIAPVYPDVGNISTSFDMPTTVAGNSYFVDVAPSGQDKVIKVYSTSNGVKVNVVLNGVNSTIPVNGSTSSSTLIHVIQYNSTPINST